MVEEHENQGSANGQQLGSQSITEDGEIVPETPSLEEGQDHAMSQ